MGKAPILYASKPKNELEIWSAGIHPSFKMKRRSQWVGELSIGR